jgi:phosphoribosylamine--glycine ligase
LTGFLGSGSIRAQNMKILVLGSGGREHAVVWALRRSATTDIHTYCAPGNAGITADAETVQIPVSDYSSLISFVQSEGIDLTFVGPEAPLVEGLVDAFDSKGLTVVGPSAAAARLEGSKIFAKDFMARNKIPTASYRVAGTPAEALECLRSGQFGLATSPVVIKADGLAAGKGVVVAGSHAEAERAIEDLMINHIAGTEAASRIVLEEMLIGVEASLLLFADGKDYVVMPAARDHKRIGENDTGPNTGGMGTITDPAVLPTEALDQVTKEIIEPTLAGAEHEGFPFKGILFLGLMLTDGGPKLLEYNVRFGDPEAQAILIRLRTDLASVFEAIHRGSLSQLRLDWSEGSSACVVAANPGYPGKHESGSIIHGLSEARQEGVQVFHAGTSFSAEGKVLAMGGRVLGITSGAALLPQALGNCYRALEKIHWPGMQFRRDIGKVLRS